MFKRLSVIFKKEDSMLNHLRVHVESFHYSIEKLEGTVGPVEENTLRAF
jgi:hypothetical protein